MFGLGAMEIVVILAIALIVLGPQKLPEVAKQLAKLMGDMRRVADDVRSNIEEAQREATPPNLAQLIADAQKQDPSSLGQTPNAPPDAVAQLNAAPTATAVTAASAAAAPSAQGTEAALAPKPVPTGEFVPPKPVDPAAFQPAERAAHGHTTAAASPEPANSNKDEAMSDTIPSSRRPSSSGSDHG